MLINQSGLDDRVTSLRYPVVTAEHGVAFQEMAGTQDVLSGSNSNESAECASTTVLIRKIVRPPARSSQKNGWRLLPCIAHCANFVHQLHLQRCTADFTRQTANRLADIRHLAIDINLQPRVAISIDAHRGSQNFRVLHK